MIVHLGFGCRGSSLRFRKLWPSLLLVSKYGSFPKQGHRNIDPKHVYRVPQKYP